MTPPTVSVEVTRLARGVLLVVVAACDTGKPADVAAPVRPAAAFRASCATPSMGVCTEYAGDAFGTSLAKTGCLELRGRWSPAHCPPERRLGTCAVTGGTRVYYPGGELDFTSTTAARDCVELYQGAFSPR
ncbi:MAG: hypothetical protein ABTQ32_37960 [Myxococcaceae bacterium]